MKKIITFRTEEVSQNEINIVIEYDNNERSIFNATKEELPYKLNNLYFWMLMQDSYNNEKCKVSMI